jgi:hypothetical protein
MSENELRLLRLIQQEEESHLIIDFLNSECQNRYSSMITVQDPETGL